MTRLAWLLLLSAISLVSGGCAPGATEPGDVRAVRGVRFVAVQPDLQERAGVVLLQWQGELEKSGELFAVLDDHGYRGLVRTLRAAEVDCDHCPGPLVEAVLLEGPGPTAAGAVAVGPIAGPTPRARLGRVARPREVGAEWRTVARVDLDGDGRWDLVEKSRCGHTTRSGCASEVCDMTCSGVTKPGAVPDTPQIFCVSFLPDVEDCETTAIASGVLGL